MGRLFLVTPHYCIPIRFDDHDHDQDLLCRGMEEGVDVRQQPPPVQPNPAAWRFFRIFVRSFTATAYMGMGVFAFVGRHFNWFPELQDPFTVAFIIFIALVQVGCVFMITQGDVEANSVTAQGEQHL